MFFHKLPCCVRCADKTEGDKGPKEELSKELRVRWKGMGKERRIKIRWLGIEGSSAGMSGNEDICGL